MQFGKLAKHKEYEPMKLKGIKKTHKKENSIERFL